MSKLRVMIADDHSVVRAGLRVLLEDAGDVEVVGEADGGQAAVALALETHPDVVVMDLSMPGGGGDEATVRLRQERPEVRVVVLTAHEDPAYLRKLLLAGACGYLLKRSATEELIRAVRAVAGGSTYVDPTIAAHLVAGPGRPGGGADQEELTEREAEVLRQIAIGYSNKQIAARLELSIKTVETYKTRGMNKLKLRGRVALVGYASRRGWLVQAPAE